MNGELLALPTCLVAFSLSDYWTRTIPLWLTLPALVLASGGHLLGWWVWSPLAAGLAWAAVRWATLPAGDQKAIGVVAGFLGLVPTAWLLALSFASCVLLLTCWKHRAAGWPFFPIVAAWACVLRYAARTL
jgi:hypothetical protein